MPSIRLGRVVVAIAGAIAIATLVVTAGASARTNGPSSSVREILPGSKPAWTSVAPQAAAVPSGRLVHARVWLTPRNAAQLDALAQAVSDPSSAQYGQFLTADQYNAQYAPTAAQVGQVTQWLTGSGLSVTATGPDNHFVAVAGSASAVAAAFGTPLADYARERQAGAGAGDRRLGARLARRTRHRRHRAQHARPRDEAGRLRRTRRLRQRHAVLALLRRAVGEDAAAVPAPDAAVRRLWVHPEAAARRLRRRRARQHAEPRPWPDRGDHRRVRRAIAARGREQVRAAAGRPAVPRGQFQDRSVPEDASTGDDCGGNGWYGEQALDVEAVHAMAPGANVLYYGAASCFDDDLLAQLAQVVHDNKASIVTNSWGEPTFFVIDGSSIQNDRPAPRRRVRVRLQAGRRPGDRLQVLLGRRRRRAREHGLCAPDYPTGDPWVTSVGGTSLAIDKRDNRACSRRAGAPRSTASRPTAAAGPSPFRSSTGRAAASATVFSEPAYQRGIVGHVSGRAVPDVGMDADPTTGMLVGETQNFSLPSTFGPAGVHYGEYRIGGTSLASPLFAGAQAVAQAQRGRTADRLRQPARSTSSRAARASSTT